jgi:hypothetical protein
MPMSSLGPPEPGATVCRPVIALAFAVVSEGGQLPGPRRHGERPSSRLVWSAVAPAAMPSKLVPALSPGERARLSLSDKDLRLPGGEVRRELCWLVANLTVSLSA